jgi:hypothetical protein
VQFLGVELKVTYLTLALLGFAGCSFADDLQWGNYYLNVWSGFGTSPYHAIDTSISPNPTLQIFCLDYNDEIAPPVDWEASIVPLTPANVVDYAQFGGNYQNEMNAAATPANPAPAFDGTAPFAFQGDAGVTLAASGAAYSRYLEAAWLFANIEAALSTPSSDPQADTVLQVAAWLLFVEPQNLGGLEGEIASTGGTWSFTDYLSTANNYATPPTVGPTISGLTFQAAVDQALASAQTAVTQDKWASSSSFGTWDLVTGQPGWVDQYGRPVQEFLTSTGITTEPPPSVPEPSAVILLGTVLAIMGFMARRKLASPVESAAGRAR